MRVGTPLATAPSALGASAIASAGWATAPPAPASPLTAAEERESRLGVKGVFWIKRELNPTTALTLLKVATSSGSCTEVTRKVRPSAQGGVVRDPEGYLVSKGDVWS